MDKVSPTIIDGKYPPKKGGKRRTPYFLVKCRGLPISHDCPKGIYQKKHSDRTEAEKDRQRLIRLHSGGGMDRSEFQQAELAALKLRTCEGPAKGKSLSEAVDWFIENYADKSVTPTVEKCVESFLAARQLREHRPKTMEEIKRYLAQFKERFAMHTIDSIGVETLREYLLHSSSFPYRRKVLFGFFSFCCGTSKRVPNPTPWVRVNPLIFIPAPAFKGNENAPVVYSLAEIETLLAKAKDEKCLPFWVWALFTGMRPVEQRRFWSTQGHGWQKINLTQKVISVEASITKTRQRREIPIRANLHAWLKFFQSNKYDMAAGSQRKRFRLVKSVLPEEKREVKDIPRHTYISNRVHYFDKSIGTTAAETGSSERIIKAHYYRLQVKPSLVKKFWSIKPETLGLKSRNERRR